MYARCGGRKKSNQQQHVPSLEESHARDMKMFLTNDSLDITPFTISVSLFDAMFKLKSTPWQASYGGYDNVLFAEYVADMRWWALSRKPIKWLNDGAIFDFRMRAHRCRYPIHNLCTSVVVVSSMFGVIEWFPQQTLNEYVYVHNDNNNRVFARKNPSLMVTLLSLPFI